MRVDYFMINVSTFLFHRLGADLNDSDLESSSDEEDDSPPPAKKAVASTGN